MLSVRTLVFAAVVLFLTLSFTFYSRSGSPKKLTMAAVLQPLKFLSIAPRAKHTATVIFIHVSMWPEGSNSTP